MTRIVLKLVFIAGMSLVLGSAGAHASPLEDAVYGQLRENRTAEIGGYQLVQQRRYQGRQRRRGRPRRRNRSGPSLPEVLAPLILNELTRPRTRRSPPRRRRVRPRPQRQQPRATRPKRRAQPRFQPVPAPDMPLPAPRTADIAAPDGRDPLPPLPARRDLPQASAVAALFDGKPHRPRDIVVMIATSNADETRLELMGDYNVLLVGQTPVALLDQVLVHFRLPGNRDLQQIVAELNADPRVISVQPNYIYRLLDDAQASGRHKQYSLAALRIPAAHGFATGRNVGVAVIDSCVDASHPDLDGTIARQFDAFARAEQDIPCVAPDAHGTAIAGIISARGELTGIAPRAHLLAARAFSHEGTGDDTPEATTVTLASSLDWAAGHDARIYNLSFAGPDDPVMRRIMTELSARDYVLVGAAGNDGPDAPPVYPAAYDGVLAVTAIDAGTEPYVDANRGDYIDLAAPGVDILVLAPEDSYDIASGTSYAAAHLSGVIALMLERSEDLNRGRLVQFLSRTARDLGAAGRDPVFGAGLANAQDALDALGRSR